MDIQLLVVIAIGVIALLYFGNHIIRQFTHTVKDPKCEDCPVPNKKLIHKGKK